MNSNVYYFNDHKDNKALVIAKGDYTKGLTRPENCFKISNPAFHPTAVQLTNLLDSLTIKTKKDGDKPCN